MRNNTIYKILIITTLCFGCSKIDSDQSQVTEPKHVYERSEVVKINGACIVVFKARRTMAAVSIPCNE
jgi:hypothetical protein